MNNVDFSSREYKRSRNSYIAQCAIDYCIALLISGVYLVKLLKHIGLSDAVIGLISSVTSFAFLIQLLSIGLVKAIKNTRKVVIGFTFLFQLFIITLYFIPFLPVSRTVKAISIVTFFVSSHMIKCLISGIHFKWANSFVSPDTRGVYSAVKEMVSLISSIVYMFVISYIVDRFISTGNLEGGFIFLGIMTVVLNIFNFTSLFMIGNSRSDAEEINERKTGMKVVFSKVIGNKNFLSIIILSSIYNVAVYATTPFMGVYTVGELAMGVFLIQLVSNISSVVRMFISVPFGKFSDKTSYATGIYLGLIIAAAGFLFNMFARPETWWLYIVFAILNNVSVAGLGQNMDNVCYSYVESDYLVQALAIKNSIGGIVGFLATLGASAVVDYIQSNNNMIFGMHIYAQQLLSCVSMVLLVIGALYCNKVIRKQKIMKQ